MNLIIAGAVSRFSSRGQAEKLFASSDVKGNEEGLISDYMLYEIYRQHADDVFDIEGNSPEKLAILYWYLTTYGGHRRKYLPLSATQLAELNRPIPIVGLAYPISNIAFSFIRQELGQGCNLSDETAAAEAIYWWCCERTPQLKAEVSLVPEYFRYVLMRQRHEQRGNTFGTNYFLDRYLHLHPEIRYLNTTLELDRAALLTYMVIKAVSEPHLARYLPTDGVNRLFLKDYGGSGLSAFQLVIESFSKNALGSNRDAGASAPGPVGEDIERLVQLEDDIRATVSENGFSLTSGTVRPFEKGGNFAECLRPTIGRDLGLEDKICLIGPIESFSGLGQASRMSQRTLAELPYELSTLNFDMDNPAPKAVGSRPAELPRGVKPASINLIHLNAESIPLVFAYLDHELYEHSYNIGFFFWELDKIPKCHRLALELLDEIWVASEYNREIYAKYADVPVVNVGMAVEKFVTKSASDRAKFGLPEDTFLFLTTFDSFSFIQRKNPLAVIESFQKAFPDSRERVGLVIKTQNRMKVDDPPQKKVWARIDRYCAEDRRIVVMNETMDFADVLNLKKSCDCYISLHRSEGWGFGLIEAMQCGIPVVATAHGGNMDFCKPDNFFPVTFNLVEPNPTEYIYVERGSRWAHPNIEDAARQLRVVFSDRKLVGQRVKRARDLVERSFSIPAIAARYGGRIKDIRHNLAL